MCAVGWHAGTEVDGIPSRLISSDRPQAGRGCEQQQSIIGAARAKCAIWGGENRLDLGRVMKCT